MTDASLTVSVTSRIRPTAAALGWLVVGTIIVVDLIGLPLAGISVNWSSMKDPALFVGLLLLYGLALGQLRRRVERFRRLRSVIVFIDDFCLSAAQLSAFSIASAPLTYILARAGLPLIDRQLGMVDHFLQFDWSVTRDWVVQHPAIHELLRWAYLTHINQCWILIILGSLWFPGRRNAELIWGFMLILLICCAVSAVLPALSLGGDASAYLPILKSLRAGEPMVLDWNRLEGIVSFPSFHAALAILYIYAARHRLWALIPFAALDTLMLISTPPIGGHYLTDVLGGIAVALIAIGVTRWVQPPSPSASDSRLAFPPAAVVSVEITRSTAKRAR
ncbi:MAG: phosphatase PAP2 family protein [Aliidongia sp.]